MTYGHRDAAEVADAVGAEGGDAATVEVGAGVAAAVNVTETSAGQSASRQIRNRK